MIGEEEAYNELCGYTLTHGDPSFIHQHVVDAFTAQHANEQTRPIGITFALVGLYLAIEKQFTGREVQRAHTQLARKKQQWPVFDLPHDRGALTVLDVIAAPEGPERDTVIHQWCASVWKAFSCNRNKIAALLRQHEIA